MVFLSYALRILAIVAVLAFHVPKAFSATGPENPSFGPLSPFQTSDWMGFGLTAISDFADLDSSYSMVLHEESVAGTPAPCTSSMERPPCVHGLGSGEDNPLIVGMFGTHDPTALDYAAFGMLELALQTGIAWILPERYRDGAWGVFVGIGLADTVMNAYKAGVTFRF